MTQIKPEHYDEDNIKKLNAEVGKVLLSYSDFLFKFVELT